MAKLKKMLVERGKGRCFPDENGQPKLDFLDMAKAVARRAGIPESTLAAQIPGDLLYPCALAGVDLRTVSHGWAHRSGITSVTCVHKRDAAVVRRWKPSGASHD